MNFLSSSELFSVASRAQTKGFSSSPTLRIFWRHKDLFRGKLNQEEISFRYWEPTPG